MHDAVAKLHKNYDTLVRCAFEVPGVFVLQKGWFVLLFQPPLPLGNTIAAQPFGGSFNAAKCADRVAERFAL